MSYIIEDLCIGCGTCKDICPSESIYEGDGSYFIDIATCIDCGTCIDECHVGAIEIGFGGSNIEQCSPKNNVSAGMSQLERDLRNLADDALTKKDAKAAFQLLAEILGAGAVLYIAANVIGALFGPSSAIAVSHGTLVMLLKKCGDVYADLPTEQRTLVRKLARGVKGLIEP